MTSYESIVRRLSPTLKKITGRLNGHHPFFDGDDLYQEALIHLWDAYKKKSVSDKTDSYILQGCYYHLKNYLRKVHERTPCVSLNDPVGTDGARLEEILSLEALTPFDYLEGKLELEGIMSRSNLAGREKDVALLLMDGMTVREIGRRLRISHVMVVKIKNKIRQKYIQFHRPLSNGIDSPIPPYPG